MKLAKFLAIGACAAFALTTATPIAFAEHKGGHETKLPNTADGIVSEIHKHHKEVADSIKAKDLKTVHDHSEAIKALANALPAKVASDKKARVDGTAKNIAKVADALHEAADGDDQAKTEAQLKKLDVI